MAQVLFRRLGSTGSGRMMTPDTRTSTTNFFGFGYGAWPVAGRFRNLRVQVATAPGAGTSRLFEFYKNAAGTDLEVLLSGTNTQGDDTINEVTYAVGDRIGIGTSTVSGAPAFTGNMQWSADFEPDTPGESGYCTNIGTTTSGFCCPFTGETQATLAAVDAPIPCDGVFTGAVGLSTLNNVGAGAILDVFLYKNGVKQDGTGGTVDTRLRINNVLANVPIEVTFALSAVRGDRIAWGFEASSYPSTWTALGLRFLADRENESIVAGSGTGTPSTGATNYLTVNNQSGAWLTDQDATRNIGGITPFELRHLYLTIDTAPGAGRSRRFRIRRDGAFPTGTPDGTISNTGPLLIDDTIGAVAIQSGELFQLTHEPSGTPTVTGDELWSLTMAVGPDPADPIEFNPDNLAPAGLVWAEAYLPT